MFQSLHIFRLYILKTYTIKGKCVLCRCNDKHVINKMQLIESKRKVIYIHKHLIMPPYVHLTITQLYTWI